MYHVASKLVMKEMAKERLTFSMLLPMGKT